MLLDEVKTTLATRLAELGAQIAPLAKERDGIVAALSALSGSTPRVRASRRASTKGRAEQVLDILQDGAARRLIDIQNSLGISSGHAANLLNRLCAHGQVIREGNLYRLAPVDQARAA